MTFADVYRVPPPAILKQNRAIRLGVINVNVVMNVVRTSLTTGPGTARISPVSTSHKDKTAPAESATVSLAMTSILNSVV